MSVSIVQASNLRGGKLYGMLVSEYTTFTGISPVTLHPAGDPERGVGSLNGSAGFLLVLFCWAPVPVPSADLQGLVLNSNFSLAFSWLCFRRLARKITTAMATRRMRPPMTPPMIVPVLLCVEIAAFEDAGEVLAAAAAVEDDVLSGVVLRSMS